MLAKDAHIQPQRANSLLKSHVSYEQMKDFLYPPTIQINIYGNKSTIKHETKRVQAFESSRLKSSHESLSDLSPLESKSQWLGFISLTDTHTYTGIIAYTPVVSVDTHTVTWQPFSSIITSPQCFCLPSNHWVHKHMNYLYGIVSVRQVYLPHCVSVCEAMQVQKQIPVGHDSQENVPKLHSHQLSHDFLLLVTFIQNYMGFRSINLLFNSYFDLSISVVQGVEPALHQQRPLEAEGCDEEVETHSTEAVPLQECHQEAKSNEDHHMDILKTWRKKGEIRMTIYIGTFCNNSYKPPTKATYSVLLPHPPSGTPSRRVGESGKSSVTLRNVSKCGNCSDQKLFPLKKIIDDLPIEGPIMSFPPIFL